MFHLANDSLQDPNAGKGEGKIEKFDKEIEAINKKRDKLAREFKAEEEIWDASRERVSVSNSARLSL